MKNKNDLTVWQALKDGFGNIDAHAWPGVIIFMLLIVIEASVNVIASIPDFGVAVAVGVGLLFGVFLGMWHIITERPKNSVKQQSTTEFVVYMISALSIILLVVNLIRIDGNITISNGYILPNVVSMDGWDYLAVILIGVAFATHLIAYQIWHAADDERQSTQNYNRGMAKIKASENDADLATRKAEIRLQALDAVLVKQAELRKQYAHLPKRQLDQILAIAETEVLNAFERDYNLDLNDDGSIGGNEENHISAILQPVNQYAETVPTPIAETGTLPKQDGHPNPNGRH